MYHLGELSFELGLLLWCSYIADGVCLGKCEYGVCRMVQGIYMCLMKVDCKLVVTTELLFGPVCVACVAAFMAVVV